MIPVLVRMAVDYPYSGVSCLQGQLLISYIRVFMLAGMAVGYLVRRAEGHVSNRQAGSGLPRRWSHCTRVWYALTKPCVDSTTATPLVLMDSPVTPGASVDAT